MTLGIFEQLEKEAKERFIRFATLADKPEECAKTNHEDWRYIEHLNLNRVHLCLICNTVVGTG